jgi:phosphoribosylaminoimidazole carboxylase (NCAIR synthetase)
MINLVGTIPLSLEASQNINAHLLVKEAIGGATVARTVVVDTSEQNQNVTAHIYGKSPRSGRKLGHITAVGENAPHLAERALNG